MPKPPALLPSGVRPTDVFMATEFAAVFPLSSVLGALEACDRSTIRLRSLSNEAVVYFVMMLTLFRNCSHKEVFRIIAMAMYQLLPHSKKIETPTASALSQARTRVGYQPFQMLFRQGAKPLAEKSSKWSFFKGLRTVALDGCLLNTDDSAENRKFFGSSTNQHGTPAAYPQTRFVGLMETGTHAFFQAEVGGYHDGESTLAKSLLSSMSSEMIILADRNFYSFDFFEAVKGTGAEFLVRVQKGMTFTSIEKLNDHSDIVILYSPRDYKKERGIKARFIQYQVLGQQKKETIFLLSTILDPEVATATELAQLYHERWEYEGALKELKNVLGESAATLRSKTPELVMQEMWGMLMTHYVIRRTMYLAADKAQIDPDRLSFKHSVKVVGRSVHGTRSDFSP
jgi:hypothetical protein